MEECLRKMLGDGPYPFPISELEIDDIIEFHRGAGMIFIGTRATIDFFEGSHAHESYEFVVPYTPMPWSAVEKKQVCFDENKIFAINSEQSHGPARQMPGCRLDALQINKETMQHISYMMCGRSEIEFNNECVEYGEEIRSFVQLFIEEVKNRQAGCEFMVQNLVHMTAVALIRQCKSNVSAFITDRNYTEKENIRRAVEYLREQYYKEYSLEEVSQIANLSPYHFIRTFKAAMGKTPYDYLLDIKIEKARELLAQKRYSITEVCFLCGFNSLEHFGTVFKRKVGILPSCYRKNFYK